MNRVNFNLYPRDGYFFKESDGTSIRADSWPGVIRRVAKYRVRAGLAPGNPEVEVMEQACQRNPAHCVRDDPVRAEMLKKVSLKGRILNFLSSLRRARDKTPIDFVGAPEAERRAAICAACPNNTSISEGCGSCKAALTEMRSDILGRGRSIDNRLVGCVVTGEDLPTAIHINQQAIEHSELPGHCWRKRTL